MKNYLLFPVILVLVLVLTSCSGPSNADVREIIRFEYNLTDIKIDTIEKSNTRRIQVMGTAKVKSQVYKQVDLAMYCKTRHSVVSKASSSGVLEGVSVIEDDIKAGTEVDFLIKLAPDKVEAGDQPELVTSGGWTNGVWGSEFMRNNQSITIFRTKAWYGNRKLIEIDSDEAQELCKKILSYT